MVPETKPYKKIGRPRPARDPRLPSAPALRRIMEDEPWTTVAELVDYYGVSIAVVRRTLAQDGLKAGTAPAPRKLPVDEELRPLLMEAQNTGFAPLMQKYGVTAAALSKAKKRLGISWDRSSRIPSAKAKARVHAFAFQKPMGKPVQLAMEFAA